jgi:hypothetical protein
MLKSKHLVVNLSRIRRRTGFVDCYTHIAVDQSGDEYQYGVSCNGAWEEGMGNADDEATYEGWCGWYTEEEEQREYIA